MIARDMSDASPHTAAEAAAALRKFANPANVATYCNFVKNSREDVFLGVTTPLMRQVAFPKTAPCPDAPNDVPLCD